MWVCVLVCRYGCMWVFMFKIYFHMSDVWQNTCTILSSKIILYWSLYIMCTTHINTHITCIICLYYSFWFQYVSVESINSVFVCLCVSEHGTQLGATICTSTCADRDEGGAGGGGGEKTETDKHTLSDLIWLHLCCFICTDTFQGKYCKWVLRVGEVFVSRFEMKHSLLCVSLFI